MNGKRARALRKLATTNEWNYKLLKQIWVSFPLKRFGYARFERALLDRMYGE